MPEEDVDQRSKVQDSETRQLREEITTAWGQVQALGEDVQESMSTTHPPSIRNLLIASNGNVITADNIQNELNHEPPLYTKTVAEGESFVLRGQARNKYSPGHESIAGQGFQVLSDWNTDDTYVPPGTEVEIAYGSFILGQEDGFNLRVTPDDVYYQTLRSGSVGVEKSLENGDWESDPWNGDVDFDLGKFSVFRHIFDLYGAGSSELEIRTRQINDDGFAEALTISPVEIAEERRTLLDQFNHPNSIRVTNTSNTGGVKVGFGPTYFANITSEGGQQRKKKDILRRVAVGSSLTDIQGSVLAVYRLSPENVEVRVNPTGLNIEASDDTTVELRLVDESYLNFVNVDPSLDSNWSTPNDHIVNETATEALEFDPENDDVTINTFTDEDGRDKMRGHIVETATTVKGVDVSDEADFDFVLDEFRYFVLTARGRSNTTLDEVVVTFDEEW